MKHKKKNGFKILLALSVVFIIFLSFTYVYHKIQLQSEMAYLTPTSTMIPIEKHNMSIYQAGKGDKTLVFLSGAGTPSPILDFKPLYSLLIDDFRIVVIEKFGYGYSDIVNNPRTLSLILEENRSAMKKIGIVSPFILLPHSMSGLEAMYWAQKYPDEVRGIIGLDMAIPSHYESTTIYEPLFRLASWAAKIGLTRFVPWLVEDGLKNNSALNAEEQKIYKAIFHSRIVNETVVNEALNVKENAKTVSSLPIPPVPFLLFLSNAQGTSFDEEEWKNAAKEYFANKDRVSFIDLNVPHYIHHFASEQISQQIKRFVSTLD